MIIFQIKKAKSKFKHKYFPPKVLPDLSLSGPRLVCFDLLSTLCPHNGLLDIQSFDTQDKVLMNKTSY